jgi:hypothetical protein
MHPDIFVFWVFCTKHLGILGRVTVRCKQESVLRGVQFSAAFSRTCSLFGRDSHRIIRPL